MTDHPGVPPTDEARILAELTELAGLDPDGELAARTDLATAMGIEYVEATAERVVARMPVEGNTQPYGLLHGGASCVLAESIGSVGSAIHAGPGRIAVGIEINATHHRSATEGHVTGVATRAHGAAPSPPTTSSSPTIRPPRLHRAADLHAAGRPRILTGRPAFFARPLRRDAAPLYRGSERPGITE